MSIEIIAIGNEVLSGMVVNTNAAVIAAVLSKEGWTVTRQTVLPDDPQLLENGLREALARSALVITTGGLGPTCDDITRITAAKIFDSPIERNPELAMELEDRFGRNGLALEDQALAPLKAKRLPNPVGTASGWLFSEQGRNLALLPGPPREMSVMLTEALLPQLSQILGIQPRALLTRTLHFCCLREDDVDPILRSLATQYPDITAGIYPGYGTLTVHFSGINKQHLYCCVQALEQDFGTYFFDAPQGRIEESIHAWFHEHSKTLALAESCTGGKMAMQLTTLPGASAFFLGSYVVYTDQLKKDVLGVSEHTLRTCGAVSQETVEEMLAGVFKATDADWAIAVSGIAGPSGGSADKPVGTVWGAIGARGEAAEVAKMYLPLGRETIITVAANRLLGALWRKVRFGIPFNGF